MSVYFIQIGDGGPVKIGSSRDPAGRLRALQTSHPEDLRLCGIIENEDEKLVHRRFSSLRIRGEWFRNETPLAGFVASMPPKSTAYRPDPWPYRHSLRFMQYMWFHEEMPSDEEAVDRMETPLTDFVKLFGPSGR